VLIFALLLIHIECLLKFRPDHLAAICAMLFSLLMTMFKIVFVPVQRFSCCIVKFVLQFSSVICANVEMVLSSTLICMLHCMHHVIGSKEDEFKCLLVYLLYSKLSFINIFSHSKFIRVQARYDINCVESAIIFQTACLTGVLLIPFSKNTSFKN